VAHRQGPVLDGILDKYPDEEVLRAAIRGAATYQLPWFDAHIWAYAERFGLETIWSEDFEHGRLYGRVRTKNPFIDLT
jgi:predicted nucleic acid-binding protein